MVCEYGPQSFLLLKTHTHTTQMLTHLQTQTCTYLTESLSRDSPCLPVIQAHLAVLDHPTRAERIAEVILLFKPYNWSDFSYLYLTLLPISPGLPRGPWKTRTKCLSINVLTPSRRFQSCLPMCLSFSRFLSNEQTEETSVKVGGKLKERTEKF